MKHLVERLRNQLALKEKQQKVFLFPSLCPIPGPFFSIIAIRVFLLFCSKFSVLLIFLVQETNLVLVCKASTEIPLMHMCMYLYTFYHRCCGQWSNRIIVAESPDFLCFPVIVLDNLFFLCFFLRSSEMTIWCFVLAINYSCNYSVYFSFRFSCVTSLLSEE